MKKSHIIGILIIALSIGAIVSSLADSSTYANFSEAFKNQGKRYQVVGVLNKEKDFIYEPQVNPDLLTFYMIDKKGSERKVILNQSKPQDFERSEEIVIKGKAVGEDFHATDILMKCPSKYEEGNPQVYSEG